MKDTGELHTIFQKFFPRRKKFTLSFPLKRKQSSEQIIEASNSYLSKGEESLQKNNLSSGLFYFETAVRMQPESGSLWLSIGKAVFHYGVKKENEKALLLASKCFKTSDSLGSTSFDCRLFWGKALFQLGELSAEHHYFLEAKTKFQEAIKMCEKGKRDALAQNFWDLGLVWTHLAEHSGEAVDVRMAIDAFRSSLKHQKNPPAEFWNDFGGAHLQMGLLINENRIYLEAIELFQKAVDAKEEFGQGWASLAISYSQLYLNTADEKYFEESKVCFEKALIDPEHDEQLHIDYAELLGESGKINHDSKKLKACIEKCESIYPTLEEPENILPQWIEALSYLGAYTSQIESIVEAEEKIGHAIENMPHIPELWYAYGVCLSAYANYYDDPNYYDLAIEKFQEGLSIDRSNAELWHALAESHSQIGQMIGDPEVLKRAIKFFEKANDLKPCCPILTFDFSLALLKFADLTDDLSALENALFYLEGLLKTNKEAVLNHPEWLYFFGFALDLLADHTEEESTYLKAIEVYQHVLLIEPDYPQIHYKMALTYSHLGELSSQTECFQRAFNHYRIAVNHDEENESIWLDWGIAFIHLSQITFDDSTLKEYYVEAEQKILKAGRLGSSQAYYHLACLYSLLGRLPEAMKLIEKANKLNVLPPIDDMLQDDWLEPLRKTEHFSYFLNTIESRQRTEEK